MHTDSLFYKIFQTFPRSFFELLNQPASDAEGYRFTSVEIKQPTFRIDGLFVPADLNLETPIYFIEVQFQPKSDFYWRLFAEIFLYLEQEKPIQDWQAVAIFARRSLDPSVPRQYRGLQMSNQVIRIYLDELNEPADRSVGVGIMKLIIEPEATAGNRVRQLVQQVQQLEDAASRQNIIELIETILIYKFTNLSRQEIEQMLYKLSDVKQTRVYQEAKEEGIEEGKLKTVPLFLQLGLSIEEIAARLELNIEAVRKAAEESATEINQNTDSGN